MGSIEGHAKGEMPFLDRIKKHNAEYNAQVEAIYRAKPWWRKLAGWLGRKLLNIAYPYEPMR